MQTIANPSTKIGGLTSTSPITAGALAETTHSTTPCGRFNRVGCVHRLMQLELQPFQPVILYGYSPRHSVRFHRILLLYNPC